MGLYSPGRARNLAQIGLGVGLPGIVPPDAFDAATGGLFPGVAVSQKLEEGSGDGPAVQRVHQLAVVAVGDDVRRTAVFGGHHGQAAGGGLQDGQPKGFGQSRIDEHTAGRGCQAKDGRHLVGSMTLGHGDLSVQVIGVDHEQDIGQHRLGAAVHVADVVTIPGHDQQVGGPLEGLRLAESLDQDLNVLAFVRPRKSEDQRFVGVVEEARQLVCEGDALARFGGWNCFKSVPGGITVMRVGS